MEQINKILNYSLRYNDHISISVKSLLILIVVILLVSFLSILGIGLVSGSKSQTIFPFIAIFFHYLSLNGINLNFRNSLKFALFAFLLGSIFLFQIYTRASGYLNFDNFSIDLVNVLMVFSRRFYGVETLSHAISNADLLYDYWGFGRSYYNILLAIIPHSIWPDKPIISFGMHISQVLYSEIFHGDYVAVSMTLLGEGIANGSILFGFFNISILFSIITIFVFTLHKFKVHPILIYFYIISFANFIEGELVGTLIRLIIVFLSILVSFSVFRLMQSPQKITPSKSRIFL